MSECSDCQGCGSTAVIDVPGVALLPQAVAVIGPPNSGKTTLFNRLTGLRQKVGQFSLALLWNSIPALPTCPMRRRAVRLNRFAGRLQPHSALGRRAGGVRCAHRRPPPSTPKPGAILLVLDATNLAQTLNAGRSHPGSRGADSGHSEYGRRLACPRGQSRYPGAGCSTGCARRAGRRAKRRRHREGYSIFWLAHDQAGAEEVCRFCRMFPSAAPGPARWATKPNTALLCRRNGPAGWIPIVLLHPVVGPLVFLRRS